MEFDPLLYQEKYRIPSARAEWWEYCEGIYFITIVTKYRRHYFGKIVRDSKTHDNRMIFSDIGKFANDEIPKIVEHHPYAYIPSWVVMPNHIHLIIMIDVRGRDKNAEYGDERDNWIRGRADGRAEMGGRTDDVGKRADRAEYGNDEIKNYGRDARTARLYHDDGRDHDAVRADARADDDGRNDNDVRADARADNDGRNINDVRVDDDDIDIESGNIENIFIKSKTDRRTSELMSAITPKSGSLPVVINQFKRAVTMFARTHKIPFDWQTRYHDRILKKQIAFDNVRRYIDNNVAKWHTDQFYKQR